MRRPPLLLGLLIVALVILAGTLGPALVSHDPYAQDLARRFVPPAWMAEGTRANLLGTDQLGRDYLARLLLGARISLVIGAVTVVVSGLIGTALGIAGGYFGGRVDRAVMFVVACRLAIPLILVALTVVSLVGSSLTVVILTLSLLLWERFAVVARGATRTACAQDYMAAARAAGCSALRCIGRELLPNIAGPLVVVATLEMANAILVAAALSFLGLGVPPPLPDWSLMIAEAKDYMFFKPWVIELPGVALLVLVLGINLVGDGLRDAIGGQVRR